MAREITGKWAMIVREDSTAAVSFISGIPSTCLLGEPVSVNNVNDGRARVTSTGMQKFELDINVSCLRGL